MQMNAKNCSLYTTLTTTDKKRKRSQQKALVMTQHICYVSKYFMSQQ